MKLHKVRILGLIFACFAIATPASANVHTTPWQTDVVATNIFSHTPSAETLHFNGFNPGLGTLVGVTTEFWLNESLSDSIVNLNPTTKVVGKQMATSTITAVGPDGLSDVKVLNTISYSGNVPSFFLTDMPYNVGTVNFDALVGPVTLSGTPVSLAGYIGGHNYVSVDFSGSVTETGISLPNLVFNGNVADAVGWVSIEYDYIPRAIPEPGSIALFSLGLFGLAMARARRKVD